MNKYYDNTNDESTNNYAVRVTILTIFLSTFVAYCFLWVQQKKKKASTPCFAKQRIPMAGGANFLLGHLTLLHGKGDFQKGYEMVYENPADPSSGLCSLWFINRPTLSVLLARHVKTVLSVSSYREPVRLLNLHNDRFLGEKALTSLNGKPWRVYRSAVHKSFTPSALKQSQKCIHVVGNTLVKAILSKIILQNDGRKEDRGKEGNGRKIPAAYKHPVLPLMKMATIDVFGLAIMDVDFQCCEKLELTPVASAFEYLAEEYTRRLGTPWNPASWLYKLPTKANKMHLEKRTFIRRFIAEQIDLAQAKIKKGHDSSKDNDSEGANLLTNILLTAEAEAAKQVGNFKGNDISKSAILDLVMTLLFGGYDTTSITLSYALYMMATHPDIQKECLREIDAVFPNLTNKEEEDSFVLEDPARQLPYTHAVVLETLRIYPPAPVTVRTLEKPIELDGKVFPQGTNVMVPIWSIQRDERNFLRPFEMNPTRWVRHRETDVEGESMWEEQPYSEKAENEEDRISCANRDAFCVFAAGARNCVGRKLALQEAVTLLAILVRKLKFEVVEEGYEVKPKLCSVVQQPHDGLPMLISPR
jgi:cytochrome P450